MIRFYFTIFALLTSTSEHRFVVLKVHIVQDQVDGNSELECFQHLRALRPEVHHPGHDRVRFQKIISLFKNKAAAPTDEILEQCEEDELLNPSPRKIANNSRVICVSKRILNGENPPVLCDFSSARITYDKPQHDLPLMPQHYRPPEVILAMPWDYAVDMWCLGITVGRMLVLKVHSATTVTTTSPRPAIYLEWSASSAYRPCISFRKAKKGT
ncbi:hypothetical protein MCOR25_010252 [Pyricularia grisea]|uniref:Protein kinase domain-containing protein n=1 Tax=Pyricularia grisea TaxID=148305 RepID=A0A6P8AQI7_PYRGI|nr:uncharacterized protein PgNI_11974 [Pyricularia grisea]KAI6350968.1 hypothetical protein MCOR25_010252 [Pyricularia grisea]TLD04335.1 hypothetical protein PgNI_11974 [Pyricularia grisea]